MSFIFSCFAGCGWKSIVAVVFLLVSFFLSRCLTLSGAAQNGQCLTSKNRESNKRADGSYAFEWLSRYFDVIH